MLCVSAIALTGCRCARESVRRPDDDAVALVDASPSPPKKKGALRWVYVAGRIVDLDARKVAVAMPTPKIELYDFDDGAFYGFRPPMLGAIELPSGKGRWEIEDHSAAQRLALFAEGSGLFVVFDDGVFRFDVRDGTRAFRTTTGSDPIVSAVHVEHGIVTLRASGGIDVVDTERGTMRATIVTTPGPLYGTQSLVATTRHDSFCSIALTMTDYSVRCFAPTGKPWSKAIVPTDVVLQAVGARHLLFSSSYFGSKHRSYVVSASDGAIVAHLPIEAAAIVERDDALDAVLTADKTIDLYEPSGARAWSVTEGYGDAAAVVAVDDRLIVAHWDRISTGSSLFSVDRRTGKVLWKADVVQLSIAHSKYRNDCELVRRGDEVALIGREAGGEYVQLFDVVTGKRLFAFALPSPF